ncbi:MAG: LysE family translocator [Burkholderiales bacterium]
MMSEIVPAWPLLTAFLVASFVLAVTPGPGVLYIVTRSLAQGRKSGIASVAGIALGNLGNAFGACVGLAALFAVSSVAFMIVKYAGALYLVYLGIQALRTPQAEFKAIQPEPARLGRIFRDGFIVALLNPKTAVFFAAFLPQFMMDTESAHMLQSVFLGSIFVAIAATTDVCPRRRYHSSHTVASTRHAVSGPLYDGEPIYRARGIHRHLRATRCQIIT